MEMLAFMKCFSGQHLFPAAGLGTAIPWVLGTAELYFNPIKLLVLIGWIYLCLYIVQYIQYSSLVSKNHRAIAGVAALFLGPILLLVLIIADTMKKVFEADSNIFEVIKEQLQNIGGYIRFSSSFIGSRKRSKIKLLDSSGRSIKEVYGHGKTRWQDSHVLDLTEQLIADAIEERASDILIDPKGEAGYTLRLRVDGVLRMAEEFDVDTCQAVINSFKAVSSMDISEKRRPQDGAFIATTANGTMSFRVASAGALHGEKLSIRVLNQNAGMFTLSNIGLTDKQRAIIEAAIKKPSGMILMCGPTGSGKTTTLYAMLNEIDLFTRNVITVEDPIEYVLPNASQIEVNPRADITFAKALRSILRQDPDVICVGEIRDEETAGIALRAAQTGHLVLATIHSSSNAAALVRLLDLGVSSLLLSSGLNLAVSQRLLRRLCRNCKMPAELSQQQLYDFRRRGVNYKNIFQAEGCEECHQTGYYDRTAIYDILVFDKTLKADIVSNDFSIAQLRKDGDKRGKSNLQKQGLKKVVSGITSLEELKRVVG